jgi:hypothetical protein
MGPNLATNPTTGERRMNGTERTAPLTGGIGILPPIVPVGFWHRGRHGRLVDADNPVMVIFVLTNIGQTITIYPDYITVTLPSTDTPIRPVRASSAANRAPDEGQVGPDRLEIGPHSDYAADPRTPVYVTFVYEDLGKDPKEFTLRIGGVFVIDDKVEIPDVHFMQTRDFVISSVH